MAPAGLCVARCVWPSLIGVCGSIDGLVVCVYVWLCWVCVCVLGGGGGSVCVVMGLDRFIDVLWVYLCGFVCLTRARG